MSPVIEGPTTASFLPGTAFVSYYLGRYDLLVKTEGEKGGKEGMEKYLCGTYFPVMKVDGRKWFPTVKDDGPNTRWEEAGDFAVRISTAHTPPARGRPKVHLCLSSGETPHTQRFNLLFFSMFPSHNGIRARNSAGLHDASIQ